MKKTLLLLFIIISIAVNANAMDITRQTADYLVNTVNNPQVASVGGEWTVIGLARSGYDVVDGYFDRYYSNLKDYVRLKDGILHTRKYTEYARVVLALGAIGKDPCDVEGYNLVSPLMDFDSTVFQGINGAIWALIALDSGEYSSGNIKEKYIEYILQNQKPDGGWSQSASQETADADVTAMAVTALSRHRDAEGVNDAIRSAIEALLNIQEPDGSFSSYNMEASESTAQVITALCSLGEYWDEFTKNGRTLKDVLLSYRTEEGSFVHGSEAGIMATEQCFYALIALERMEKGQSPLFDMNDAKTIKEEAVNDKNTIVNIPEVSEKEIEFTDISDSIYQEAVINLAKRGVLNGKTQTLFDPNGTVTRAEFAAIITRALGLDCNGEAFFADVKKEDWFFEYVNTAAFYGIIKGVSEEKFNPLGQITREEAAVMVARAAKLCGMETKKEAVEIRNILSQFFDYVESSSWAMESLAFCYGKSILSDEVMEIKPGECITRAETADMIFNLIVLEV